MPIPQKAFILAAGLGTRLRPLTWLTPKPLLTIWNKPLLRHTVRKLESWGVTDIVINTHWRADAIDAYLAKKNFNARITTSREPEILGTGGALRPLQEFFGNEPFWLINADIAFSIQPEALLEKFNSRPCIACVWLHESLGPRTVETDPEGRVTNWRSSTPCSPNTATLTGVHIVSPEIFRFLPTDKTTFPILDAYEAADRAGLPVFGTHIEPSFWADIGTPEAYLQAHLDTKLRARESLPGGEYYKPGFDAVSNATDNFVATPQRGPGVYKSCHRTVFLGTSIPQNPLANCIVATPVNWPAPADNAVIIDVDAQEQAAPRAACLAVGFAGAAVINLGVRGSNRAFWRIATSSQSAVVIEYTAERVENRRYGPIAIALRDVGVPVPRVLHEKRRVSGGGLLVLEDIGAQSLQKISNKKGEKKGDLPVPSKRMQARLASFPKCSESAALYETVIDDVFNFHGKAALAVERHKLELEPPFDEALYAWEQNLFEEHILLRCGKPGFSPHVREEYARVTARLLASPQAIVHRDLQSSNIFLHTFQDVRRWHFIDFQGMRNGAIVYDLASLLCDPYVDEIPASDRDVLLRRYALRCEPDAQARVLEDFNWGAVQRLTQATAAFGRLSALGHAEFAHYLPTAAKRLAEFAELCELPAIAEMVK